MAHYKRRKRTFKDRIGGDGRKTFYVRGFNRGAPYSESYYNTRQRLKKHIWDGWE